MMSGRPARSWVRKTYTVSEQVDKAIRLLAAEQDLDPGTVVDLLVWNAILKPDEARLKRGGFTDDELERIFAEDVLAELQVAGAVENLAESLPLDSDENANLKQVRALVKRWRTTRRIDKVYQEAVVSALSDQGWIPVVFRQGLVDAEWCKAN